MTTDQRIPPQALEMERSVLGSIMLMPEALDIAVSILVPEAFYDERNERIFREILQMKKRGEPVDSVTVIGAIIRIKQLETVGGTYYLTGLTSEKTAIAGIEAIEFKARVIMQKFISRQFIAICGHTIGRAYEDVDDVFELSETHFSQLNKIMDSVLKGRSALSTQDLVNDEMVQYEARVMAAKNNEVIGVPSGYYELDRITTGWKATDLIIVAARPSMGKTALMLCFAINAARFGFPVKIFSLETSASQLMQRFILILSGVDSDRYRRGTLEPHELVRVNIARSEIYEYPIEIDDNAAIKVNYAAAEVRKFKKKHNGKKCLVVGDYLQLFAAEETRGISREQQVSGISSGLKRVAKENDVPFIILSQLSRAVESRGGDKRPQLSDLRDSGAIEQDADMVMFIYRPEYYGFDTDEGGNSTKGIAEIIIAKHRDGALGNPELRFIPENTKFTDKNDAPYVPSAGLSPNRNFHETDKDEF